MKKAKARELVLAEWRVWRAENEPDGPTPADGLALGRFYSHLENNRPELLNFRTAEPKLLCIRNWLRYAGELR